MPLSVVDLITRCGLENARVQFLPDCITGAKLTRGATEVRFMTNELHPGDLINASRKIGVIVWLPREKVEAVQNEIATAKGSS